MNSKNKIKIAILFFISAFFFSACNTATKEEAKEEHHEGESAEVQMTAEQIKAIGLETDSISYRNLKSTLKKLLNQLYQN